MSSIKIFHNINWDCYSLSLSDLKVKLPCIMVCILQQVRVSFFLVSIMYGLEESRGWVWVLSYSHMIQLSVCYFLNIHASTFANPMTFSTQKEFTTRIFHRGYEIIWCMPILVIECTYDLTGKKLVWWIWYLSVLICAGSPTFEVLKMGWTWMKSLTVIRMNLLSPWMIYT